MILWLGFAVLTAIVVGAVLAPLARDEQSETVPKDDGSDLEVYRDQLSELENDQERGLIDPASAEAARAELARRILSRADGSSGRPEKSNTPAAGAKRKTQPGRSVSASLIYALALFLPMASAGLYLAIGSPGLPAKPHAGLRTTSTAPNSDIEDLVAQVEARLRARPDDGRGWDVLAPVYMRLSRFDQAQTAYRQAIAFLGPSPQRLAGLGRAAVRANDGEVTPEAQKAFKQLLVAEPDNIEALLWLARAKEQAGDVAGARADFEQLLAKAPKDAPWRSLVEQQIAALSGARPSTADAAPSDARAPALENGAAEAVEGMSQDERTAFITQMVERLASRLAKEGGDFDSWLRLVRAYAVLGRVADAKKTLADARKRFGDDVAKDEALDALERKFNLGS